MVREFGCYKMVEGEWKPSWWGQGGTGKKRRPRTKTRVSPAVVANRQLMGKKLKRLKTLTAKYTENLWSDMEAAKAFRIARGLQEKDDDGRQESDDEL